MSYNILGNWACRTVSLAPVHAINCAKRSRIASSRVCPAWYASTNGRTDGLWHGHWYTGVLWRSFRDPMPENMERYCSSILYNYTIHEKK